MSETSCDVITKVKIDTTLKPPTLYSVIYFNDETTSVVFVVQSLIDVFGYSMEAAIEMAQKIDEQGSGNAASGLPKELANHLRDLVIVQARSENFPLVVTTKEDGI